MSGCFLRKHFYNQYSGLKDKPTDKANVENQSLSSFDFWQENIIELYFFIRLIGHITGPDVVLPVQMTNKIWQQCCYHFNKLNINCFNILHILLIWRKIRMRKHGFFTFTSIIFVPNVENIKVPCIKSLFYPSDVTTRDLMDCQSDIPHEQ